jgi:hypothetical protein
MIRYFLPVAIVLLCTSGAIGQVIRTEAGLVKKLNGEVLIHCHNRDSGFSRLRDDEALHREDLVVTGSSGLMVFSLNAGSSLQMSPGTTLRVRETILSAMHFDVDVGEVIVLVGGLKNGASLVLHAPPAILEIRKKGLYRVSVNPDGTTQVNVIRGEILYPDRDNRPVRLKKGKQVDFLKRGSRPQFGAPS